MLPHGVNPHQNPNATHVDSGVVWSPGVADTSDVLVFGGCEVHLEAALGWGLLFSSVRHEARTLIRTHLLVREMLRSDYSSNLISFLPHFSYSTENRLPLVWQTDTTTRRWHWTTVSNLEDFAEFHRSKSWKGTRPTILTSLPSSSHFSTGDELKRGRKGCCWFVTLMQRSQCKWGKKKMFCCSLHSHQW